MSRHDKPLDNIDKKLISLLGTDGRMTYSQLGRLLNISHVAARKRLERLTESNIVKITSAVNSEKIGMMILFMAIETENIEIAEDIIRKYRDCPRILLMASVTGRYNLFAILLAEDTWTLESILGTCSIRTEKGIRKSETWFGNAPIVPMFVPLNLAPESKSAMNPCNRTCENCRRYHLEKCVGCPAGKYYRGSLWVSPLTPSRRSAKSKS